MNGRLALFVVVTCAAAALQVGAQKLSDAKKSAYQVPATVAQEVAAVALAKYVRECSWEQAHYTYYISSADKRIDVEQLIREMPVLPNVLLAPHTEGVELQTLEDVMQAKLKSIATIKIGEATPKRVRVTIGRYVSPLGITHADYVVERRWLGWLVVEVETHKLMS